MTSVPSAQFDIDRFIGQTQLIPAIVLDGVNGELCQFLARKADTGAMYAFFHSFTALDILESKTAADFEQDAAFKASVSVQDPRPAYYSYVRRWVAVELQARFPALLAMLPTSFQAGTSLV